MAGNVNSGRKPNARLMAKNLSILLDEIDPVTQRKRMIRVLKKLIENAEDGDNVAINAIMDRVDGKPATTNELSGPDGGAIPISIKVSFGE